MWTVLCRMYLDNIAQVLQDWRMEQTSQVPLPKKGSEDPRQGRWRSQTRVVVTSIVDSHPKKGSGELLPRSRVEWTTMVCVSPDPKKAEAITIPRVGCTMYMWTPPAPLHRFQRILRATQIGTVRQQIQRTPTKYLMMQRNFPHKGNAANLPLNRR